MKFHKGKINLFFVVTTELSSEPQGTMLKAHFSSILLFGVLLGGVSLRRYKNSHNSFSSYFSANCDCSNFNQELLNGPRNNSCTNLRCHRPNPKYVFRLTPQEKNLRQFNIRYSSRKNLYERTIDNQVIKFAIHWKTWTYRWVNIERDFDHLSNIAFLSRKVMNCGCCDKGLLQWKFSFGVFTIKSIDFKFVTKTFGDGVVIVAFFNASGKRVSMENLIGTGKFSLKAILQGGKGIDAWENAKILCQSVFSEDRPFQLSIKFN